MDDDQDPATRDSTRHGDLPVSITDKLLGSVADTEDVLQGDVAGWAKRSGGGPEVDNPRAYLVRIAVNQALARRSAQRPPTADPCPVRNASHPACLLLGFMRPVWRSVHCPVRRVPGVADRLTCHVPAPGRSASDRGYGRPVPGGYTRCIGARPMVESMTLPSR
jgi:hypothetical protein